MNTRLQTDIWIHRILFVLGIVAIVSAVVSIALTAMSQPVLEIIPALGLVAVSGLVRLLISPLNREL